VKTVIGEYITLNGEEYFKISNSHLMDDFFMSLVGAGDHWMFISSSGALTAGRRNADSALFPYASDDQITNARASTGSVTLVRFADGQIWEPFTPHSNSTATIQRNLYKTPLGNKLVFEEINESRQLSFRYRWTFSKRFGFIRSCQLQNLSDQPLSIDLLDGIQNILPPGVGSEFFMRYSNLANAYKRSECLAGSKLGIFYLSSVPTDKAEPSEGLRTTTVWQSGLNPDATLIAPHQIKQFRANSPLQTEEDVRGKTAAYLTVTTDELSASETLDWQLAAEVNQDHAAIIELDQWIKSSADHAVEIEADIDESESDFLRILSSSDALQCGANARSCNRHLSNTVFNVMRGGVPLDGYQVRRSDFIKFVSNFNDEASSAHQAFLEGLPESLSISGLQSAIEPLSDPDLTRLSLEYLPLAFSRRHGDPTRPWNHFSIELKSEDGQTNLDYQGNWRDIFQNWEALQLSFPEFSTGMISRFVNATTADGYNPYRVTRNGFDWEVPEPDDPWANIGYWGDHQIIYLLKLLEWNRKFYPGALDRLLNTAVFTHANVPYRIKSLEAIKKNPQDTIEYDLPLAKEITNRVETFGADGKLLRNQKDTIHNVTLVEKLLTLSLAKMSNFIPDGGIWLNTQRPEWNDANNALVGNGLSMVTACYLHRWFKFLSEWIADHESSDFSISIEVATFLRTVGETLIENESLLSENTEPAERENIVEALSMAGSRYREALYSNSPSGAFEDVPKQKVISFFQSARRHLESTIRNNRRADGLFHAYNLLDWNDGGIEIEQLYEMLEGQVAALSSGLLSASEAVELLDALRESPLYRENQDSYLLYPDRQLPKFLDKNTLPPETVASNPLLQRLITETNESILVCDVRGDTHFNGNFRNSNDLKKALNSLDQIDPSEKESLVRLFEEHFGHRQFTGRSGTFFGYEGLGSIYWHMVSKLGLAISENIFWAVDVAAPEQTIDKLRKHYRSVKAGIGAEKSPTDYGAFPTDPYSHTPENAGVKQPGMTGQVKEDVLARFSEIGVHFKDGGIRFRLDLFDKAELLDEPSEFKFYDSSNNANALIIPTGSFAFTLFQIPFIYQAGDTDSVAIHFKNGESRAIRGTNIDPETSAQLFSRSNQIDKVLCTFKCLQK